jgi:molecular chaperone GrpE
MATKRRTQQQTQPRRPSTPSGAAVEAAAPDEAAPDEAAAPAPAEDGAERRLAALASQMEEANGRYLRLAADFDNFKKRANQERVTNARFAAARLAERLLTVVDDAERALSHAPEGIDENWLKGVRLVVQQLQDVLASEGVERIESVGAAFDPSVHEAIGSEESGEQPEDTVVVELRPGYRMHDRVLRPALVRVARRPR